jgi:ABC-type oligopeptide transport system substrate-binding subunit
VTGLINRRQMLGVVPLTALGLSTLSSTLFSGSVSALQAELAEDQTLRLASWALPTYIRPSNEGGPLSMMTLNTFMSPFYEDEAGNMMPGICTDWSVSEDGLTYTLTMDPAAKFSDGTPVTAADLKFSWEYMTWPETASWASSYLTGPIVGYADVVAGTTKELAGLVVPDDATLEITLSEPYTPFNKAITLNVGGVVKKENVLSGDDWDTNPVCCGPYKLESWNKDSGEINWVVNEHWWKTPPTIQKVNYRYVQDSNTQGIMYDNNEVDVIQPSDILAAQLKVGPNAAELLPIPQGGTVFFAFDTTRAPFEDVDVRRALLKASDMGTIIQAVFQGGARPAFGLTSPNLAGFADPGPYFDPEGAKAALAASTYGSADKLPPISVRVPTNVTEYVRVAEALQQMWKETLGIDITISLRAQGEEADDGISQIFRLSFGTLFNDPAVIVAGLGLSTNSFMVNWVKAKNAELDAILLDANTRPADEVEQRIALCQQAETMLMDQAYYIPIIWVEYYFATKPWVNGLKSNSVLSLYTLPEMTISAH